MLLIPFILRGTIYRANLANGRASTSYPAIHLQRSSWLRARARENLRNSAGSALREIIEVIDFVIVSSLEIISLRDGFFMADGGWAGV